MQKLSTEGHAQSKRPGSTKKNADRMCLASYVSGLNANVGKMGRIQNSQKIQQALTIVLAVTEAERQDKG